MTQEMKDEFIMLYLELIDEADQLRQRGFSNKAALLDAQAEGMRNTLEIFGYTLAERFNEMLDGNEVYITKG